MEGRHRDDGARPHALAGEVLATCPACGGCVRVVRGEGWSARAACHACAWTGATGGRVTSWGGPADPYLGLPRWLQTPCCGASLWAFDAAHLDALESFVAAGPREKAVDRTGFSMLERLPAWLTSAKHRDEVLAGVARLRRRLAEA